jgi:predicted ABC-class ATPase
LGTAALLARTFQKSALSLGKGKGTGKSGEIRMEAPDQEVLPQTAVLVSPDGSVEARFTVGLPAQGRRVLGKEGGRILLEAVPKVVGNSLRAEAHGPGEILRHALTNEDAEALRGTLPALGLVAFVADGSFLPRRTGVSQEPLVGDEVVPFVSPERLRVQVDLPNAGPVSGMGVPEGVTLIVGGGYHGKSTLLRALERGVYNHRPGDGREQVVARQATVKIRAEDGRSIRGVDISPFIKNLPNGEDTRVFNTPNASGSTSQAANIVEAVEAGATALLVDEDTATTNFMIRDRRMQALISKENEPITPFVDRIRQLYEERGVSSILVLGGSGDYLEAADTVMAMEGYRPMEVTARAREIAETFPTGREPEDGGCLPPFVPRCPQPDSLDPRKGRRAENLKVRGLEALVLGREEVDLAAVDQIVSWPQMNAIGRGLLLAWREFMDGARTLSEILDLVETAVEREGLDVLDPRQPGDLTGFRRFELAAALNRVRTLKIRV